MRRWMGAAATALRVVSDRPALWVPGALAWTVTVGWIPIVAGVARPPTVAELTFLGARIFTSGAWPWNALGIGIMLLGILGLAFVLVASAEASLLRAIGSGQRRPHALQLVAISVVTAGPALAGLLLAATAIVVVAPAEFNSPAPGGPILRTLAVIGPFLVAAAVVAAIGAAVHAAAARLVGVARRDSLAALRDAPGALAAAGVPAAAQVVALVVTRVVFVVLAAVLARVLWAPIGSRLDAAGFDVATGLLLVGFVAIWLCIVLAGGALHAWGSTTWTLLLDAGAQRSELDRHEEHPIRR